MSISEIIETAKPGIEEVKKQMMDKASDARKAAEEKIQILDMEREIRMGKISAELTHKEEEKELKKIVSEEAKELKDLSSKSA